MNTNIRNNNGDVSRYGFACGYIQSWTADGSEYYGTSTDGVALSMPSPGGGVFDVRTRRNGASDVDQFDSLTDARIFYRKTKAALRRS